MIAQLRGAIVQTDQNSVIIDVGGVGYAVTVSGRTQGTLAAAGGTVTLLTDMQVREDSMTLYGFVDSSERDAFRLLVTVQGTTSLQIRCFRIMMILLSQQQSRKETS